MIPGYLGLHRRGELAARAARLVALLSPCQLCPRRCGAARLEGERGRCGVAANAVVAAACTHRGEEPPISGQGGAGTLFFAGCSLRCSYCQNHQISRARRVPRHPELTAPALAELFLERQAAGCENLALVTPGHVLPQLLTALDLAAGQGLRLPLVYNSAAWERLSVLRELDGVVDIYLPDLRYGDDEPAALHSQAEDYVAVSQAALREMARQVGPGLILDERGVARRGLLVRHLVLPAGLAGTEGVAAFLAEALGSEVPISLMAQYRPPPERLPGAPLERPITPAEYQAAIEIFEAWGFGAGYHQRSDAVHSYRPDFDDPEHPFEDRTGGGSGSVQLA